MDFDALADFLAVSDAGGVAAGARQRGEPKQSVSRRLLALEAQLGVRLFDRSTRALRLTPEGAVLRESARRVIADIEETRRALSDRSSAPEGLLRISAPVLLGQTILGEIASRLLAAHPRLRLEISLSDRRVDLIEEGFDAAIRVGLQGDSSLISRVLAYAETVIVAAPSTLATWREPAHPVDLAKRPCIVFGNTDAPAAWTLSDGVKAETVKVTGRLTCTSLMLCLDAAIAGVGFANLPAFIARQHIASGAIERVLPTWRSDRVPVRIVYSSKRLMSARLRVFLEEAVASLGSIKF